MSSVIASVPPSVTLSSGALLYDHLIIFCFLCIICKVSGILKFDENLMIVHVCYLITSERVNINLSAEINVGNKLLPLLVSCNVFFIFKHFDAYTCPNMYMRLIQSIFELQRRYVIASPINSSRVRTIKNNEGIDIISGFLCSSLFSWIFALLSLS